MKTLIASSILSLLLASIASAQPDTACDPNVTFEQVIAAMGPDIRIQPVFSPEGLKGWRLYWSGERERLASQGIKVGSLMTHVCGFAARDVDASGRAVNCGAVEACQIEVTFQIDKAARNILLTRAAAAATS